VNFQVAFGGKFFVAQKTVNVVGDVFSCFHDAPCAKVNEQLANLFGVTAFYCIFWHCT
jgi:hypothetical protein